MSGEVVRLDAARERRERQLAREAEPLMTKQQLARHFAVHPRTIERWMEKGCPVAQRLWGGSGAPRFHLSAVIEWHEQQRH